MAEAGAGSAKGLARQVRGELVALLGDAGRAWREGRRPWIAATMCVLTALCAAAEQFPGARTGLAMAGDVYARLPLGGELARMPLSVFLPTADLPVWAAVAQIAAVVGIAELVVGRVSTAVVAGAGQALSTLAARCLIALGPAVVLGLPLSQAGVLDTGPSGISTALGGWLLARRGAYASLTLLTAAIVFAAVVQFNLDGREHAAALVSGVGVAVLQSSAVRALPGRAAREARALWTGVLCRIGLRVRSTDR
ncbi:MAG TPA: hypothetical protein VGM10_12875 [Actinocrinis sp.]|jgi:hypothetical protein